MLLLALQSLVRAGADILRDRGGALLPGQGVQGHLGARVGVLRRGVRVDAGGHLRCGLDLAGGGLLAARGGLQILGYRHNLLRFEVLNDLRRFF
ncbi:hypothetical protein [Deinococcus arenae]|uniref:hypothetical protein n=1 Tax=Deinococcus arenae TaxID=1452751 RepID=UPI000D7E5C50|nr:hypothetical protein [Deinococcus arenae]AWT35749.1 hypothetical protein DM785_09400 [Deinococcus actinosclerus]